MRGRNDFGSWKVNSDTLATSPNLGPTLSVSPWKKIISFPVLLAVLLAGGMFVPLRTFSVDPDVWWHIKVGATLLSTHRFPTTDPYSFTASGSPWIAYEWLGELLLGAVERAWGLPGLMALDLALATAILLALYVLATLRCRNATSGPTVSSRAGGFRRACSMIPGCIRSRGGSTLTTPAAWPSPQRAGWIGGAYQVTLTTCGLTGYRSFHRRCLRWAKSSLRVKTFRSSSWGEPQTARREHGNRQSCKSRDHGLSLESVEQKIRELPYAVVRGRNKVA